MEEERRPAAPVPRPSREPSGCGACVRRLAGDAATRMVTPDEVLILALMADGLPVEAISRRIEVSARTVRRRVRRLCDRLDVRAPVQAVAWAVRHGVI